MPTPADLLLALALINSPVGTIDPEPSEQHWPAMSAALTETGLRHEWIDDGEHRYDLEPYGEESRLFASLSRFAEDVDFVRQRRVDLAGAPKIADGAWLPDATNAGLLADFYRQRRDKFRAAAAWHTDRASLYEPVILQSNQRMQLYDAIRCARTDGAPTPWRREYLAVVRKSIGLDLWVKQQLPEID